MGDFSHIVMTPQEKQLVKGYTLNYKYQDSTTFASDAYTERPLSRSKSYTVKHETPGKTDADTFDRKY
jgi:hypothetical protein